MGASQLVLLDVGRDPARRRPGRRRQGPELRHRLRVRHPHHDCAQEAATNETAPRRAVAAGARRRRRSRRSRTKGSAATSSRSRRTRSAAPSSQAPRRRSTSSYGVGATAPTTRSGRRSARPSPRARSIAIIASLLVISAYIALRFEWKFAVPVLIALMHDLLITGGVYSLTGREVTTSTVAALLTILGFSLYDTIIVFDRIRENVPRMPRAAFTQIVNRSMSEVLTRSLATSFCDAAADPRAVAVRRRDAARLRVRAARRHRLGHVLVDLHRLAGADALEGARAGLPAPPAAPHRRPERRSRAGLRDASGRRAGRRRAEGAQARARRRLTAPDDPGAAGLAARVRGDGPRHRRDERRRPPSKTAVGERAGRGSTATPRRPSPDEVVMPREPEREQRKAAPRPTGRKRCPACALNRRHGRSR